MKNTGTRIFAAALLALALSSCSAPAVFLTLCDVRPAPECIRGAT